MSVGLYEREGFSRDRHGVSNKITEAGIMGLRLTLLCRDKPPKAPKLVLHYNTTHLPPGHQADETTPGSFVVGNLFSKYVRQFFRPLRVF